MPGREKDTNFKIACYIDMSAPLTLCALGFPCSPRFEETVLRATLVWNALLSLVILKSDSARIQKACVHTKYVSAYPGFFILAKWWCGPSPHYLWILVCFMSFIFQMNLRVWTDGQFWWLHLPVQPSVVFLGQYGHVAEASARKIGRELRDSVHSEPGFAFYDWFAPALGTLAATTAGVAFLYFRPALLAACRRRAAAAWQQTPAAEAERFDPVVVVGPPEDGGGRASTTPPPPRSEAAAAAAIDDAAAAEDAAEAEADGGDDERAREAGSEERTVVDGYMVESFRIPGEVPDCSSHYESSICCDTSCTKGTRSFSSWSKYSASQGSCMRSPDEGGVEDVVDDREWAGGDSDLAVEGESQAGASFDTGGASTVS